MQSSKVKRPQMPAFSLEVVEDHNDCVALQSSASSVPTDASHCESLSKILEHVYLGSWRDAEDDELLQGTHITHVLNVAHEVSLAPPNEFVTRRQIPLEDRHHENILPHFEAAFAFINSALGDGGKVLVHCRRGISRSPAIVVGYLMSQYQYTYDCALLFVSRRRQCVSLNLAFRNILEDYVPGKALMTRQVSCQSDSDSGQTSSTSTENSDPKEDERKDAKERLDT